MSSSPPHSDQASGGAERCHRDRANRNFRAFATSRIRAVLHADERLRFWGGGGVWPRPQVCWSSWN